MSTTPEPKASPTLGDVLPSLLRHGCPCRFPRFVYLVGFNFQDYNAGPVCCQATEELVYGSYHGSSAFLDQRSEWLDADSTQRDYQCKVCGAGWEMVFTDYSINLDRSYLKLKSRVLADIGADAVLPFPVSGGISGFSQEDIDTCTKNFKQALVDECFNYLIQTK